MVRQDKQRKWWVYIASEKGQGNQQGGGGSASFSHCLHLKGAPKVQSDPRHFVF